MKEQKLTTVLQPQTSNNLENALHLITVIHLSHSKEAAAQLFLWDNLTLSSEIM